MGLIHTFVHIATERGNSLATQRVNVTPSTGQMLGHSKAVHRTVPGHLDLSQ